VNNGTNEIIISKWIVRMDERKDGATKENIYKIKLAFKLFR
jgi:hypothetical protein